MTDQWYEKPVKSLALGLSCVGVGLGIAAGGCGLLYVTEAYNAARAPPPERTIHLSLDYNARQVMKEYYALISKGLDHGSTNAETTRSSAFWISNNPFETLIKEGITSRPALVSQEPGSE